MTSGVRYAPGAARAVANATSRPTPVGQRWLGGDKNEQGGERSRNVNAGEAGTWRYRSAARSDKGRVRARNEDSVVDRPEAGVWAVADGMGGHDRGDRASAIIREELAGLERPDGPAGALAGAVRERLDAAHARVRAELGGGGPSGSTVVALAIEGGRYACFWAGDSRLYRCAGGAIERLTTDHSLVQELVDAGALPAAAAGGHPLSNRITRAVGVEAALDLAVREGEVADGERYLLSSDGLHGLLDDPALARLAAGDDLDEAADALVAAALDAGGTDNVSVVLVAVEGGRRRGADPKHP